MSTMWNVFFGLGPALRRLREGVAGLTQTQLAERTGIAQGRLSRYETGRKIPDLATLDRLLTFYGTNLEGLSRALSEVRGGPVPESDPELMTRIRAALMQLGAFTPRTDHDWGSGETAPGEESDRLVRNSDRNDEERGFDERERPSGQGD